MWIISIFKKFYLKICFYFSTKYVTICVIKTKKSDNHIPSNTTLMSWIFKKIKNNN